ncbi:uncharacterized protein TRUGW13939_01501 [Talaromyces rugulosus]|uniref:Uncharacterized protein n=1 Tax=Talaromyces rugulosus TaxID=121627 RepID=A0A7H8QLK8_TALRU|nr:uncharacterized protein TRUGW13939_01501 [Talaromyces rugulosus]QKX54415.1 hypothetical protein TRUGW13939_01501 [Talaromyces rugulosus]
MRPHRPAPSRRKFILERDHAANTQTPAFRRPPRYIVSGNYTPSATEESPTRRAGGISPETRVTGKRPAFVLPRSPSPPNLDHANPGSPPFSPTSTHSLGRRGRPKSAAAAVAGYVPGGMAEQVRNWILEMGMKREQQPHGLTDPGRYSFTARVESCRNGYLASSGPVITVHATQIPIETNERNPISRPGLQKNLLLLGQPTYSRRDMQRDSSMSQTSLTNGDVIGIHSSLTWEIELDDDKPNAEVERKVIASSQSPLSEDGDDDVMDTESSVRGLKKWQVAAEWDLLTKS